MADCLRIVAGETVCLEWLFESFKRPLVTNAGSHKVLQEWSAEKTSNHRAKRKLRDTGIRVEVPGPQEINERLESVLHTIYLLFNEGYYSSTQNSGLRKDLCFEAIRLASQLVERAGTNTPSANALLAHMYFHASRFEARVGGDSEPVLYYFYFALLGELNTGIDDANAVNHLQQAPSLAKTAIDKKSIKKEINSL